MERSSAGREAALSASLNDVPYQGQNAQAPLHVFLEPRPELERGHWSVIEAFADAIRNGGASPVPPKQALKTIRILDGIYRSQRSDARSGSSDPGSRPCLPPVATNGYLIRASARPRFGRTVVESVLHH